MTTYEMISALIFTSVGGLCGYCYAYAKKKGEYRATQENFDNIRQQLRKTTQDTEEIKLSLASKSWLTQQHWNIREQQYVNLLTHLTKFKLSLQDRSDYYQEPGSQFDETSALSERFQRLAETGNSSYQVIWELIGPASIFLSPASIGALEKLVNQHWGVAEFSACTADYVSETLLIVESAISIILKEAKKELARS